MSAWTADPDRDRTRISRICSLATLPPQIAEHTDPALTPPDQGDLRVLQPSEAPSTTFPRHARAHGPWVFWSRLRGFDSSRPNTLPLIAIALGVVLANGLILTKILDENPINWLSGLTTSSTPSYLPGQNTIDPSVGWITQGLGHLAAMSILHGHVPWWNPYEGLGGPLAGELGSAALFPLTPLLALANGHLYMVMALEFTAGISTYFFVRRFTVFRAGALAAALAFSVNGTYSWLSHATINPVCFLPLILLGVEHAFDATANNRKFGWILVSIGLALAIYGGFPSELYWFIPFIGTWVLVRAVQLRQLRIAARFLLKLTWGGLVGVLLSAPLLISFVDYLPNAIAPAAAPGDNSFVAPHALLSTQVLPYLFGPIGAFSPYDKANIVARSWDYAGGYVDTTLIVLAIVGIFGARHRVLRLFLAAWVLLYVTRLFGFPPSVHLIDILPGSWLGFERYASPTWELSLAILSGLAIDDIARLQISRRRVVIATSIGLIIVGLTYVNAASVVRAINHAPDGVWWSSLSIVWGAMMVVAVGLVALLVKYRRRAAMILVLLVAVDALAMYVVPQFSSPRNVTIDIQPVKYLQKHVGTNTFFTLGPIAPNYGSYFGISSADVIDIPVPKKWGHYLVSSLDPSASYYNFTGADFWQAPGAPTVAEEFMDHLKAYQAAGVKYVVAPQGDAFPSAFVRSAGLRIVFSDSLGTIYLVPHSAPMYTTTGGGCQLKDAAISSVTISCDRPVTLIRRQLYMPGWQASVDGRSTQVVAHGKLFQAVRVPKGRSVVTFTFEPPHILLAWLAFIIGLMVTGVLLLEAWRHRTPVDQSGIPDHSET